MALYKYFKREPSVLPDPNGCLSKVIPSSSISEANKEVKPLLDTTQSVEPCMSAPVKLTRGHYHVFNEEEKAMIAKRAAEFGVTNTIRYFNKKFPDRELKESTVRTWTSNYKNELAAKKKRGEYLSITKLASKKRGRPLLLGEELDKQVRMYIQTLGSKGCPINTAIVMATATGIVKSHDSNLLSVNGGHIDITKHWGKNFLLRIGYVKRRANTKSKITPENFDILKSQFLFDIKTNGRNS